MIAELGHYALILSLLVAVFQTVVPLWAAQVKDARGMVLAGPAAIMQFLLIVIAFAALTHAYVVSDFSLLNVYQNSHTAKPMIYKIAGVWGNHEGSMLLWLVMLSFFGALVAATGRTLPMSLKARVLGIQALIGVGFIAFSLFTSNPFERIFPVPMNGTDLNPLLQDPGLAFHPPFLYLGYVGFSVAFSFAVAALLEGRVDPAWARWVRPWTLLAWAALTLGIAMGSWWAYYELGWGGYWFWDPVENASLMPWLAGTALLHCAIVVEKRDTLKLWTILMAITAFSTSLLGTFIVRSGVLTSVHSFASDPGRGVLLLILCGLLTGGALILFAFRGAAMKSGGTYAVVSRESALILNNLVLSVLLFTILIGTFWPTIAETLTGERVSVGPPYFNAIAIPLMLLLAIFLSFGVLLPWKRGNLKSAGYGLRWAAGLVVLVAIVSLLASGFRNVLAAAGLIISLLIIAASLTDIAFRSKLFRAPIAETGRRLRGFTRAYWGGSLAHIGMGVAILGMVGTSLWVTERLQVMAPGDTTEVGGYTVRFNGVDVQSVSNYRTEIATVSLLKNDRVVAELTPERRWYPVARQMTTEAAILPRWFDDVYVAIGEPRGENGEARIVRTYYHPLVLYLWGGSLLMVIGGLFSLSDRRLRVGAPRPAKRSAPAVRRDLPAAPAE